jgi:hypothetical protein
VDRAGKVRCVSGVDGEELRREVVEDTRSGLGGPLLFLLDYAPLAGRFMGARSAYATARPTTDKPGELPCPAEEE